MIPLDWVVVGPATVIAVGAMAALLLDAFYPRRTWLGSALPSLAAVLAAGAELARTGGPDQVIGAWSWIILGGTLLVLLGGLVMNFENAMPPGEFHFLLLSAVAGALMAVAARDLVTLIVAIELVSLPSIALVGLRQGDRRAIIAAWTFFLASATATAITLMGVGLLYGITGSLYYSEILASLAVTDFDRSVVASAVLLVLIGLLFKLGAVPFHVWIPDAYRGASVVVAGFLSTVSKVAAMGALVGLLAFGLSSVRDIWAPVLAVAAAVTMTVGNLGALRERNAVGMLAWSSIGQAGFVLATVVALPSALSLEASVQYLAVYTLANLVAFSSVAVIVRIRGGASYSDVAGVGRADPWMGLPLAFAALVLAGFPPAVIGLVTKYVALRSVLDADYTWLAVVMAVNIMIGLAYYLRFIVVILDRPESDPYVSPSPPVSVRVVKASVIAGAMILIVISVAPGVLLNVLP